MPFTTGLVDLTRRLPSEMRTVAIAGEGTAEVADAFVRAGGPPPILDGDHFTLLSRDAERPSAGRVRDLRPGSADLVVLRRAWQSPRDVRSALDAAVRAVEFGGEVIAADLDVDRLLDGPSARYPIRLLYLSEPAAASRLRASSAQMTQLGPDAVRVGLVDVVGVPFDDVRGTYDHVSGLWEAVRKRGWRGAAWVPVERRGAVFDEVAAPLAVAIPSGPAVDREPWYAVVGTKR